MLLLLLMKKRFFTKSYPASLYNVISVFTKRCQEGTVYLHSAHMPVEYKGYKYYGTVDRRRIKIRKVPLGNAMFDPLFVIDINEKEDGYSTSLSVIPNFFNCVFHYIFVMGFAGLLFLNAFESNWEYIYFTVCFAAAYIAELSVLLKKTAETFKFIRSAVAEK